MFVLSLYLSIFLSFYLYIFLSFFFLSFYLSFFYLFIFLSFSASVSYPELDLVTCYPEQDLVACYPELDLAASRTVSEWVSESVSDEGRHSAARAAKKAFTTFLRYSRSFLEHLFAPPAYGGNHLAVLVLGHQASHVLLFPQSLSVFAYLLWNGSAVNTSQGNSKWLEVIVALGAVHILRNIVIL